MDETGPALRARLQVDGLAPRVAASWHRSEEYGVSLESVEPVFAGTVDEDSLFSRCGREVLGGLARTLAAEPISLMLTDADGLVLDRRSGDHALLRELDDVHLAPGFSYSEREAGTNGLGLALADRVATVVRAEEHYALSLCTYTCAAVPVLDPVSGRLEGAVNLTTWSRSSSGLLLALAQSAAGSTAALMLARSQGRAPRRAPRGEVFRVEAPRLEPGSGSVETLGPLWEDALSTARRALAEGHVVAAVGEEGSGRTTLLAQAERLTRPRERILAASAPAPQDVDSWLDLWTAELGKPHTAVLVRDVDLLPVFAAERLRDLVRQARSQGGGPDGGVALSMTAERFEDIPAPLAALVETVVRVAPLRERPDDVLPLVQAIARQTRGREVEVAGPAQRVLRDHDWPGNVAELRRVVKHAAGRSDVVEPRHLPANLMAGTSSHHLSRIETFERDEIVRVLTIPGTTMAEAATELGMSRATVYRKIAQYDLHVPRG